MSTIDDKTKVPLYAVLGVLPFLIGGIMWLTSIDSKASEAKIESTNIREMLTDVRERVIRIETQLKSK